MAAVIGGQAPRLSVPSRFGLLHTTRLFTEPYATGASGYTFLLQTGGEVAFDWVRLVYMNVTASPYTIGAASLAASAHAPTNGYSAYKADGSAQAWTPVRFNAGGANGLPPSPAGSAGSLVVAAGSAAAPTLAFSDWMQVSSVPPDDGGTFHHLLVRTYVSSGAPSMPVAFPIAKLSTAFPTIGSGRNLRSYYASGDQTAATGALTANGPAGYVTPVAVQFYARRRGMTVLDIGDSLAEGLKSTSDHNGAGFQAVRAVSSPAFPVYLANHGYSGQPSATFYAAGKGALDAYSPDVALMAVYSSNDTPTTAAIVDAAFARAVDFAHYCLSKGTVPVLKTAPPYAGTNAASDALRIDVNGRVRALSPGILVADYDAALSDGGTPARLKPALDSGDGLHPNDAGYAACAERLVPILSKLVAVARAA